MKPRLFIASIGETELPREDIFHFSVWKRSKEVSGQNTIVANISLNFYSGVILKYSAIFSLWLIPPFSTLLLVRPFGFRKHFFLPLFIGLTFSCQRRVRRMELFSTPGMLTDLCFQGTFFSEGAGEMSKHQTHIC